MLSYSHNSDIDEMLGLGDLNDTPAADYVTAGSRIHYQVEATLSTWDQFSPKAHAQAVADALNSSGAFSNAIATFPDFVNPLTGLGTLIIEVTSRIDRSSIQDIAGNIRQEAAAAGFAAFSRESINFITRADYGRVPDAPLVDTSFPGGTTQAGTPFLSSLAGEFGVGSNALLIAGGVVGLVVLLSLLKR